MTLARALVLVLLLVAPAAPWARAAEPTREEALQALAGAADAEARQRAVRWLAEKGAMEDIPALVQALRDVDSRVRAFAENAMWQVWSRSGDAEADRLFAVGVEQMQARQAEAAVETFTGVIARRPEFAEGWNKRATVYYLLGEYTKSLADCDEVLKRNPYHFGALSGYGMIYLQLDQPTRALEYFERALAVNPNLSSVQEAADRLKALLIRPPSSGRSSATRSPRSSARSRRPSRGTARPRSRGGITSCRSPRRASSSSTTSTSRAARVRSGVRSRPTSTRRWAAPASSRTARYATSTKSARWASNLRRPTSRCRTPTCTWWTSACPSRSAGSG